MNVPIESNIFIALFLLVCAFLVKKHPRLINGYSRIMEEDNSEEKMVKVISSTYKSMLVTSLVMLITSVVAYILQASRVAFLFTLLPILIMSFYIVLKMNQIVTLKKNINYIRFSLVVLSVMTIGLCLIMLKPYL